MTPSPASPASRRPWVWLWLYWLVGGCVHPVSPETVELGSAPRATDPPLSPTPSAARYHYLVAMRARSLGEIAEAEIALGVALLYDPASPDLWMAMADVSRDAVADPRQELYRAEMAARYARGRPEPWARLGLAQLRAGDGEGARLSLETAILRGADDHAWATLTELLWGRDEDAARALLTRWAERPLQDPDLLARRGELRLKAGDWAGAARDLGASVAQGGADEARLEDWTTAVIAARAWRSALLLLEGPAGHNLGELRLRLALRARDPARAATALGWVEATSGRCDGGRHGEIAVLWAQIGRADVATTGLERARRCGDPDLLRHRAEVLYGRGRATEALKVLADGADAEPMWRLRGEILLSLGRSREALRAFHRCDPSRAAVREGLARAYAALGDAEAVRGYAADAGPEDAVRWLLMTDQRAEAELRVMNPANAADWRAAALLREGPARVLWLEEGQRRYPRDAALSARLAEAAGSTAQAEAAWIAALMADATEPAASRWLTTRVLSQELAPALREMAGPWLRDVLEREPARVDVLDALGVLAEGDGRRAEAAAWWEEAANYRGDTTGNTRR